MGYSDSREMKVKITGDNSELDKALSKTTGGIKTAGETISNFAKSVGKAVQTGLNQTSLALGATGAALTIFEKSSLDYTTGLVSSTKALQRQIGGTVEDSSRLSYVLQRMTGDADSASTSFNIFSKKINDATNPLKDYGVATKDASGHQRSFNDILLDTADKFKGMPDGIGKTNMALDLFGRSGTDMIKVLNLGSDGIKDLEKQADSLGLTLTENSIGSIAAYIKSQKDLQDSTNGLKVKIGTLTAPILTQFNTTILAMAQSVMQTNTPLGDMVTYIAAFGGPVATAGSALTGFMANIFTVSKGLGIFMASTLGLVTVLVGGGGLLFALGSVLGLDMSPIQKSLGNLFNSIVSGVNNGITYLKRLADTPAWANIRKVSQGVIDGITGILDAMAGAINNGSLGNWLLALGLIAGDIAGIIGKVLVDSIRAARDAFTYLMPKLVELWSSIQSNIIPILLDLWHNVIEPLIPVIGTTLVWAFGALVDIASRLSGAIGWVYKQFQDGNPVVWTLVGAFAGLAAAMAFNAIFDAITVGFTTLRLVTIPNAIASVGALNSVLSTPMVMPAIVIAAAIASIAAVIGKAQEANDAIQGAHNALDGLGNTLKTNKDAMDKAYREGRISTEDYKKFVDQNTRDVADLAAKRKEQLYTGFFGPLMQSFSNVANYIKTGKFEAAPSHFASGTSFAPGGVALVGEQGPELVNLPQGAKVLPARETSNALAGGGSGTVNLTVNVGMYAGMPVEKREIALELYKELVRAARAQGVSLPMIGAVGVQ